MFSTAYPSLLRIFPTSAVISMCSCCELCCAADYDTQVALTEALCRMVSEKKRAVLASQWFPMEFVSTAFKGIKDSEFETVSHVKNISRKENFHFTIL